MAGWEVINREKAVALQEALDTIKQLFDDEPSERLHRAQHDIAARGDESFVFAMLLAAQTRVIASLEERIRKLEAQMPVEVASKK